MTVRGSRSSAAVHPGSTCTLLPERGWHEQGWTWAQHTSCVCHQFCHQVELATTVSLPPSSMFYLHKFQETLSASDKTMETFIALGDNEISHTSRLQADILLRLHACAEAVFHPRWLALASLIARSRASCVGFWQLAGANRFFTV